ncbi:hypothetical protein O181_075971 [Austropuccinia psidii MF-1]|uniref:Uncharacterized protein n=1 Tax=Austropuccinia psidii MF-1 TaxID=1389203 RepID=A0A9Q3FFG1_9BASI|nr:hypothetical protein [Austropuccinia psidii MF-1]
MQNSYEETTFNIERDRPISWLLKQKELLTALHPDISETMVHKRILKKCSGDLEHAMRRRFFEPDSTEYYINAVENITTRKKIGINWYKPPIEKKASEKTRINEIEIEKADETTEINNVSLHESDSEPSEEELKDQLSIENINVSFKVTEVHTHLPQYSDEFMDPLHVQDTKMQKTKPSRGKGYTAGSSFIINIVINIKGSKIYLEQGAF